MTIISGTGKRLYKNEQWINECLKTGKGLLKREGYEWSFINDINYPQFVLDNLDKFGKYFSPERK